MAEYVMEKITVLNELYIVLKKDDKERLKACKTEMECDRVARSIILNYGI